MWRQRPLTMGTPDPDDSSCSLAVLEKQIAGLHRVGDVPGYEIPSRFFKFVRTGDARPLEAVMEHNRLDLSRSPRCWLARSCSSRAGRRRR